MASSSRGWRSLFGRRVEQARFEDVPVKESPYLAWRDPQGRSLVARVRDRGDLGEAVRYALALLLRDSVPTDTRGGVLLLPRFGGGTPPFSTAPDFLEAVAAALRELGFGPIRVLDARGPAYPEPAGLAETCDRAGCELVDVREGPWVRVNVGGALGAVTIPRAAYEAERLVLLPCPLVNPVTRFTMALALAQELLHPEERETLRQVRREERLVELNLAARPWLATMDARRALVSDDDVATKQPGYVLASGDPIALDVAALKLLKGYPAKNKLDLPVWGFPQVSAAVALGLGATREDGTHLVEE